MKKVIGSVQSNMVGGLVGGVAGYLAAKKLIKSDKMLVTVAAIALGVVAGAMIQSKMKAKSSVPTAATTK